MKQETIDRIRKFTEDRDWDQFHSPDNLAKSIVIEAAELLECFQWSDEDYDLDGYIINPESNFISYFNHLSDVTSSLKFLHQLLLYIFESLLIIILPAILTAEHSSFDLLEVTNPELLNNEFSLT